jgi:hypothetical protein
VLALAAEGVAALAIRLKEKVQAPDAIQAKPRQPRRASRAA